MAKGYTLQKMKPSPAGSIMTACIMSDFVTGEIISSMGGGSLAISEETFKILSEDDEVRQLIKQKVDALSQS